LLRNQKYIRKDKTRPIKAGKEGIYRIAKQNRISEGD
jgi:hypothetical protein